MVQPIKYFHWTEYRFAFAAYYVDYVGCDASDLVAFQAVDRVAYEFPFVVAYQAVDLVVHQDDPVAVLVAFEYRPFHPNSVAKVAVETSLPVAFQLVAAVVHLAV